MYLDKIRHKLSGIIVLIVLSFFFMQNSYAMDDDDYIRLFKKMWSYCNTKLYDVYVDDVVPGAGRWNSVIFVYTYDEGALFGSGKATYRAKMKISKDGKKFKCCVYNLDRDICLCGSEDCKWIE